MYLYKKAMTLFFMAFAAAFILCIPIDIVFGADQESDHYRIPTDVLSAAGDDMGSENYSTFFSFGQSSPLMSQSEPPYSETYNLFPGFVYTLGEESVNIAPLLQLLLLGG